MLTKKPLESSAGRKADMISVLFGGGIPQTLQPGIYLANHHNGEHYLDGKWEHWPELSGIHDDPWTNCFGVCDDVQQLLDRCPMLTEDPDREFAIFLCEVRREHQPAVGGWRWHKWGPYIGTHEPQCEYLADETGIDRVFCYHVCEKRPEPGLKSGRACRRRSRRRPEK